MNEKVPIPLAEKLTPEFPMDGMKPLQMEVAKAKPLIEYVVRGSFTRTKYHKKTGDSIVVPYHRFLHCHHGRNVRFTYFCYCTRFFSEAAAKLACSRIANSIAGVNWEVMEATVCDPRRKSA